MCFPILQYACRLPIRHQGSILPDRSKVTVGHDEKLHDTCFSNSWQMNVPRGLFGISRIWHYLIGCLKWRFFIDSIEYPRFQVGNTICAQLTLSSTIIECHDLRTFLLKLSWR